MTELRPRSLTVLRWLGFPFTFTAVFAAGSGLAELLHHTPAFGTPAFLVVLGVGFASAIYLSSRVAPSHRWAAIILAAVASVLLCLWIMEQGEDEILVPAAVGIALGVLVAWRRRHLETNAVLILRWIGVPVTAVAVFAAFVYLAYVLDTSIGIWDWAIGGVIGLGLALAIYLSSRVAPSHRGTATILVALTAALLCLWAYVRGAEKLVLPGVFGIGLGVLLALRHRGIETGSVAILRWIGFPLTALAIFASSFAVAVVFYELFGRVDWVPWSVVGLGFAPAIYLGSRVAPSQRGVAIVLAAAAAALFSLWVTADQSAEILPAAAIAISLGIFLGWRHRHRETDSVAILRWFGFVGTAVAVSAAALFLGLALADALELEDWTISWVVGLGFAPAIYLSSRVAPSHRGAAIALAATAALLFCLWIFIDNTADILLPGAIGIGLGVFLALRQSRPKPRRIVLAAEGKSRRYKGTAPYQDREIDRKTFFGRDRESRSLRSLVLAERLVVLFAKSGMGKSSLINAGLVEPLRKRGYFPMTVRLTDRERGPLGSMLDGVRSAARMADVDIVGGDDTSAWRFFKTAEFWSRNDDLLRPVLIIDQFEELFTLHPPGPRREFIGQLAELVRGRAAAGRGRGGDADPQLDTGPPDLKIVLSLREDFFADLEELAADIPGILRRRFRLGPLTAEGAKEAIVGPARLADEAFDSGPFTYQEDAVRRIIAFLTKRRHGTAMVGSDEVEPAQLQLVCQYLEELVHARQSGAGAGQKLEISGGDVGDETQLKEVLEGFYDRTVEGIRSPWERRRVQQLCERRLISGGGRRLTEDEEEIQIRYKVSKKRLQALVNARLLRPEPRLGAVFYELSHDTLIEPIQQSRKKRVQRERLISAGAVSLVALVAAGWWLATKDQNAYDKAIATLPQPDEAFQPLVEQKLDQIEAVSDRLVRDRERYVRLTTVVLDAMQKTERNDELRNRAEAIWKNLVEAFRAANPPPTREVDEILNRRVTVLDDSGTGVENAAGQPLPSAYLIHRNPVTNEEYRRFDRSHPSGNRESISNVSWYHAMSYAAWLGGTLPTDQQRARVVDPSGVSELEWCREKLCGPEQTHPRERRLGGFRVVWQLPTPPTREEDESLNPRIRLPGGEISIGDDANDTAKQVVKLSPFTIQEHEVTNKEFKRFRPDHAPDDKLPVTNVSWDKLPVANVSWYVARSYAKWLGGDLATEAQWQFAARANCSQGQGWCRKDGEKLIDATIDELAVYRGHRAREVKSLQPNHHGLYDIYGNVWEWCRVPDSPDRQALRGGSYTGGLRDSSKPPRASLPPGNRTSDVGFRVVWDSGEDDGAAESADELAIATNQPDPEDRQDD